MQKFRIIRTYCASDEQQFFYYNCILRIWPVSFSVYQKQPRLLRFKCSNFQDRATLLKHSNTLRSNAKHNLDVFVNPDLTFIQRARNKHLREELKRRRNTGGDTGDDDDTSWSHCSKKDRWLAKFSWRFLGRFIRIDSPPTKCIHRSLPSVLCANARAASSKLDYIRAMLSNKNVDLFMCWNLVYFLSWFWCSFHQWLCLFSGWPCWSHWWRCGGLGFALSPLHFNVTLQMILNV